MPELVLYHFEACPFCGRVRDYMQRHHITIPMKDIRRDVQAKTELKKIGGKTQVPCLVIDGKPLYESFKIIEWFRKNWKS